MSARHILVSGSRRGIGHAICQQLLSAGHRVTGISRQPADDLAEHPLYRHIALDLSDGERLSARLKSHLAGLSDLSAVVSNAGGGRFGALENFSHAQITEQLHNNLLSHMWLARSLLPLLKRQSSGHLLFIGSESALRGGRFGSVYSAAKFGLRGFAQSLRHECSTRQIGVTCINPGMVRSDFFERLDFQPGPEQSHALHCDDVARAALYALATPPHCVVDEINLSPLKHVVQKKSSPKA